MDTIGLLIQQAERFGGKTALDDTREPVTFAGMKAQVFGLAAGLRQIGVKKGDKVAIYLPNCREYVYSYLACFCLGAVAVPLDYQLKGDELAACLGHSESGTLIAQEREDVPLAEIRGHLPGLQNIILTHTTGQPPGGGRRYEDIAATSPDALPRPEIQEDDPALIMYTSGSTGRPKGILLNYKHLDGSPRAMKHFVDLSERDVKLCSLPLSHIAGFIYIQNCLIFGITLIIMERFHPLEFLKLVDKRRVTCFHVVPAMYTAILSLKQIERFDLSSLRWVVVFGAPSSPEIMERFHRHCPNARLLNGWGMTETCPPNTVTPFASDNIAAVGKPAPFCEIRIVDEEGRMLPAGGVGEVVIRSWTVMAGYYKDPETTREVLRDGWLHTGDLGRFDQDGFLYIVGRKKEMIKVGGQIVYAPEVEEALYKHEAVAEAAVLGVPDRLRGEAVKAFVVLREGFSVPAEELRYFAREHLAHFKVPHIIELRPALPKNRAGKIDKVALKEE